MLMMIITMMGMMMTQAAAKTWGCVGEAQRQGIHATISSTRLSLIFVIHVSIFLFLFYYCVHILLL